VEKRQKEATAIRSTKNHYLKTNQVEFKPWSRVLAKGRLDHEGAFIHNLKEAERHSS